MCVYTHEVQRLRYAIIIIVRTGTIYMYMSDKNARTENDRNVKEEGNSEYIYQ